jgi:hypothetical protein
VRTQSLFGPSKETRTGPIEAVHEVEGSVGLSLRKSTVRWTIL